MGDFARENPPAPVFRLQCTIHFLGSKRETASFLPFLLLLRDDRYFCLLLPVLPTCCYLLHAFPATLYLRRILSFSQY